MDGEMLSELEVLKGVKKSLGIFCGYGFDCNQDCILDF